MGLSVSVDWKTHTCCNIESAQGFCLTIFPEAVGLRPDLCDSWFSIVANRESSKLEDLLFESHLCYEFTRWPLASRYHSALAVWG